MEDSMGTAFQPRPEEAAAAKGTSEEAEDEDSAESMTESVVSSRGKSKTEGLTEKDWEDAGLNGRDNEEEREWMRLTMEQQALVAAKLCSLNPGSTSVGAASQPASYKQVLEYNLQAQADHSLLDYIRGLEVNNFMQHTVDETNELQRQQQLFRAQGQHDTGVGEPMEISSTAGQENGGNPPADDRMPG